LNKYFVFNNYKNFLITKIFTYIAPIIRFFEKKKVQKYAKKTLKHQPIFIIGAPRTGSTILYQTLTNQTDVLYIDNLVGKFYRNLFFGFWLSNKLFKQKAHNCFSSNHGSTKGLHSPSECGDFWYRWLPKDRHFIDDNDITDKMVKEIREEISAVINRYDKPLVFKNLNAGQRLRLIVKCFPNAKLIFVKRDPFFTVQSILQAKRKNKIPENQFWGIMPQNVKELKRLDWCPQIVGQVYFLEKQIIQDLSLFSDVSTITVNYTDIEGDYINNLANKLGLKVLDNYKRASLYLNQKNNLNEDESNLIQSEIKKYNWL